MSNYKSYLGKTPIEHQTQINSLKSQGFRIISLSVNGDINNTRYAAVWVQRDGPAWVPFQDLSLVEYQNFYATQTSNGFRPVIISIAGSGSNAVFAGMFEQDPTLVISKHGLTDAQFMTQCNSAWDNNQILRCITVYGPQNNTYAGIWETNTNKIAWNYSLADNFADYLKRFQAYTTAWMRPAMIAVSADHKFFAIWYDNSIEDWMAYHNLTTQDYQTKYQQLMANGLVPVHVQAGGQGNDVRLAAIFAKDDRPISRQWTVTGIPIPQLTAFDKYMKDLIQKFNVRAGSLAIVKDHRLVFAHAYTWAEPNYPLTQPTSLFRIASTTKPLTSIAIHQLIEKNQISLNTKVQQHLGLQSQCGGNVDPRLNNVEVSHILYHSGGWDKSGLGFDPMFNDIQIANACGDQLPVTKFRIASYTTGKSMQFDPGAKTIYSNYGFSLLGRIVSSLDYIDFVQQNIFRPLGLRRPRLGRSLVKDKFPDEVRYHSIRPGVRTSVITPTNTLVPDIYGGFNLENIDSVGGWVMAAVDYAKVLASFDMGDNNPILKPSTVTTMWTAHPTWTGVLRGWFKQILTDRNGNLIGSVQHNGWLPSNSNLIIRRSDKLSFVLFLNQGYPGMLHAATQGIALNDIANKVTQWPTVDLFPTVGIPSF